MNSDWYCNVSLQAPKIQRLVTPVVLQRRRHRLALKKKRLAKRKQSENEYAKLLAQRKKESKVNSIFSPCLLIFFKLSEAETPTNID